MQIMCKIRLLPLKTLAKRVGFIKDKSCLRASRNFLVIVSYAPPTPSGFRIAPPLHGSLVSNYPPFILN